MQSSGSIRRLGASLSAATGSRRTDVGPSKALTRGVHPVVATRLSEQVGLSSDEAERRLLARGELRSPPTSRSYASIVRANVFTVFNLILAVFGGLTLALGDWRDALFLGILVSNAGIGIVQEARAKRALDRLSALVAPTATVVRDGEPRRLGSPRSSTETSSESRQGIRSSPTASSWRSAGLRLDESVLTGESEPSRATRAPRSAQDRSR